MQIVNESCNENKCKGQNRTSTKKKKAPRKKANQPNLVLSESLSSLLGKTELPRTQVIKEVWDYIKAHKLQDPDNKRMIVPDKPLGKVLGTHEPIDMFKMTGALSKNLSKKEA